MTRLTKLSCTCGQVKLEAEQDPIISTECHCSSCREAAAKLQALQGARPLLEPNGGTRSALYRKDRVRFVTGTRFLREFRLTARSRTRRVVAMCCSTPVFMEFQNGHWIGLYGHLWPSDELPRLDLRTMTADLPDPSFLTDEVPNAKRQSISFFAKLLRAWVAMGFRSPKIDFVMGELHA